MEIIWLVLLVMVPLFAGGLFALYRQNRTGTAKLNRHCRGRSQARAKACAACPMVSGQWA